jgi:hypothetical protein
MNKVLIVLAIVAVSVGGFLLTLGVIRESPYVIQSFSLFWHDSESRRQYLHHLSANWIAVTFLVVLSAVTISVGFLALRWMIRTRQLQARGFEVNRSEETK